MVRMRLVLLLSTAVVCGGCFHMTTVLKANADGTGTIEHTMVFTTQALNQLRQMAMFRGGASPTVDPISEQQAREMASVIGEGVTYVSSKPITTPIGQGREATYAFTDINKLAISMQPAMPSGMAVRTPALGPDGEAVTFSLTRDGGASAMLHIHVPQPNWLSTIGSANANGQLMLIKTLLTGARIHLAVEPTGALVATTSPYVEGRRVTLLELDLDEMLKDDTLVPRLTAAKTQEEIAAIAKSTPGLKINLDREITVEFTPEK